MPSSSRVLPFGPSCFILLGLFIAARLLLSFLPCESWGASGYLCAGPYLFLSSDRSHTCTANRAIPEGARLSNRLDFLTFRQERFTVDERGFRNGPDVKVTRPELVLFGSSFSLGMALKDDETLSARLNEQLGPIVYNAAATFQPVFDPERLADVARASGSASGWILLEIVNRGAFGYWERPTRESLPVRYFHEARASFYAIQSGPMRPLTSLQRRIEDPYALISLSTLLNMRIHDDRLLPNPFRDLYSEEQLITGRHVLMYAPDKKFSQQPANVRVTVRTLVRLRDALEPKGYHLAVLLLPNAYSVYYPLLRHGNESDSSESYMAALYARLSAEIVPALNLLPPMRAAARRELSDGRLIYFPDDAHWNALGCEIAARQAAPWLRSLMNRTTMAGGIQ